MNILVTGGAGFIGGHFVHYMLKKYADLRLCCADKLTYAACLGSLRDVLDDKRLTFVRADICNGSEMSALFASYGFDAVVNFAAESHVDRSILSPEQFVQTNVMGTQVLIGECIKGGVRFHQVSTDEVYGDMPAACARTFNERSALRPSGPYSASKAAADLLVLAYCRTYGLRATISRSVNNYGSRQFPEKLIPVAVGCALENRPVPLYGDGRNERDWIAVEDHCSAIDVILQRGRPGGVYNVSAGCVIDNLTLVKRILAILGKDECGYTFVTDRKGHDRRYASDSSELRALGWQPQVDFRQGIEKTVRWYESNRALYDRIASGAYLAENEQLSAEYAVTIGNQAGFDCRGGA